MKIIVTVESGDESAGVELTRDSVFWLVRMERGDGEYGGMVPQPWMNRPLKMRQEDKDA